MASSIGPVVNCENTVNGNPAYMTKTKNPNVNPVAGAYPSKCKEAKNMPPKSLEMTIDMQKNDWISTSQYHSPPRSSRIMVRMPVKTFPKTQQPLVPILAKK